MDEQKFQDEYLPIIDNELQKRSRKWTLSSVPFMDFDDVKAIIRHHIWRKMHLYDPNYNFKHWVNRIISNQIKNLLRNNYYSFTRPCLNCPEATASNGCHLYGEQCNRCPLYAKWEQSTKKRAHDVRLPLNLQSHSQEVYNRHDDNFDIHKSAENLHEEMRKILSNLEWKCYRLLYIEFKTEKETARQLGYKTYDDQRSVGDRQVNILKKQIIEKVKDILGDDNIEILE